jgi:hypothetical protein
MRSQPYFFSHQIERYLLQFTNIFSGFTVKVGVGEREQRITVPVMYGSIDKVVASIRAGNTQNKPVRLPVISTLMTGIEMAPDLFKGIGQEDRHSYLPSGGLLPDDIKVVHRYMPIPYRVTADTYVFVSNQHQQLELLEQLLILFDPTLLIQTNDSRFDWTKLTYVELKSIALEETVPAGGEERNILARLSFDFPIWLTPPAKQKADFVEKIFVRVGIADELDPETIAEFFDGVPLDYIKVADAQEIFKPPTE